ncbi:hypothetical protein Bsph_1801 [Lysinibacillus sphaericus C3-41]|uniref:Uncharacterized protein n=1 Tax=Lysinibacillus sphaericus (strain C3-41) TaxID=444177 RepID=B1HSC4_LYSSC|nr:hypothetical protein Bsph_1801 [Lysinibacillus sphaericus C3-41]
MAFNVMDKTSKMVDKALKVTDRIVNVGDKALKPIAIHIH